MNLKNRVFKLAARPVGFPKRSDWSLAEETVRDPGESEFVVGNIYISLDPAMRGWMNAGKSYVPPVGIGEVMRALALGRVVTSQNPKFAVGDYVSGPFGVQQYCVSSGSGVSKADRNMAPLPVYLSALGMPGMTAYFCLLEVGKPRPGETVVISAASGAVGAVAGQIAKIKGCRAVGIAGGAKKCAYLREIGFDAAIDYKAESVPDALAAHCPKSIDVYFDNVGGDILEAALALLNHGARVAICGAISQYNSTAGIKGPSNYLSLLIHAARMEGFLVLDYVNRYAETGPIMAGWLAEGRLKSREHIVEGLDNFPEALLMLFKGENFGKLILQIAEP